MKKALSLLLVCLMVLGTLAACTPANPGGTSATPPAGGTSATPPAGNTETPAEPVTITVEIFDRGTDDGRTDPTDNVWTDWIKAKILEEENIIVEFVAVSRWEEVDQLNNRMAAGTAPDLCYTYSLDLISSYRDLGGLVDLAPYYESGILSDLDAFLGDDMSIDGRRMIQRNMNSETGEIYSFPAIRVNIARNNTFIRKDWLDALGMDVPSTTEEFYEAMKAFKEKDPGNVGANKVIPFLIGAGDIRWRASNLMESFINPNLSTDELWTNTVIDRHFLVDGYKEGVRFLNKLYNEGLTDTDFALHTDDVNSDNLIKSGVVGAFIHNWDQAFRDNPGLLKDLQANVPGAELVAVDCFTDANGVTTKNIYDPAGLNYFIPKTAADNGKVEAALRYINWLSRYENYNYLQIGEEGINHDLVEVNGEMIPKVKSAQGTEYIQNSGQNIDYTMMLNGLRLDTAEKTAAALTFSYSVEPSLIVDAFRIGLNNGRPAIIVPVVLSASGPYTQVLTDKGDELLATAIRASVDSFDSVWEAGIADWRQSGADEIIAERAEKLAEYNAAQ